MLISHDLGIIWIIYMYSNLLFSSKLKQKLVFKSVHDIILSSSLESWPTNFNNFLDILSWWKVEAFAMLKNLRNKNWWRKCLTFWHDISKLEWKLKFLPKLVFVRNKEKNFPVMIFAAVQSFFPVKSQALSLSDVSMFLGLQISTSVKRSEK